MFNFTRTIIEYDIREKKIDLGNLTDQNGKIIQPDMKITPANLPRH